jgi:hypothetical protein
VIHRLTANIGQFKHCNSLVHFFFFEGRMFSRCIVTNITSARGTLHCRKTRIFCRDQLVTTVHSVSRIMGLRMRTILDSVNTTMNLRVP